MIKGECLCGAVQFEVASVVGPSSYVIATDVGSLRVLHTQRSLVSPSKVPGYFWRQTDSLVRISCRRATTGIPQIRLSELWLSCAESDA